MILIQHQLYDTKPQSGIIVSISTWAAFVFDNLAIIAVNYIIIPTSSNTKISLSHTQLLTYVDNTRYNNHALCRRFIFGYLQ